MLGEIGGDRLVHFESYELDIRSRELRRGGERVRLQAQPFEILVLMLERPGQVVTREELVQRLWPNGTFVDFEHSLNAAVKRLRAALGDNADSPRFVETLPRKGYRFIGAGERDRSVRSRRPRVAVLPFTDDGGESTTRDFCDGLTDEMILQLGRSAGLGVDVVARSSSLAFRGGACLAREIGASLRADYLLEGSVRRQGDRARIAAWLVETPDETQLWADVYDRYLTDALSVQADVASRIAASLAAEIPLRSRDAVPSLTPGACPSSDVVRQGVHSPNRFGLDPFYEPHVWAWRENPNGTFVDWNPRVTCDGFSENP